MRSAPKRLILQMNVLALLVIGSIRQFDPSGTPAVPPPYRASQPNHKREPNENRSRSNIPRCSRRGICAKVIDAGTPEPEVPVYWSLEIAFQGSHYRAAESQNQTRRSRTLASQKDQWRGEEV
jgi:hypothetical protein